MAHKCSLFETAVGNGSPASDMSELFGKLKTLDAFPKVNEDFYQRTMSGGVITLGSSLVMLALFLSELSKPCTDLLT